MYEVVPADAAQLTVNAPSVSVLVGVDIHEGITGTGTGTLTVNVTDSMYSLQPTSLQALTL